MRREHYYVAPVQTVAAQTDSLYPENVRSDFFEPLVGSP